jgi:folylpolyglutamate synthase/dihydropteroate synthase
MSRKPAWSFAIAAGLAHPVWSGRLDLRRLPDGREALLDAAHNPAGAAALAISGIATLIPARAASRILPVDILRDE